MAEATEETGKAVVKVGVYILGTLIGLGAKLATINYEKGLSMKAVIYHTLVAFACAWLVWFGLQQTGYDEYAMGAAVIVGRFGDLILIQAWRGIKKALNSALNITK